MKDKKLVIGRMYQKKLIERREKQTQMINKIVKGSEVEQKPKLTDSRNHSMCHSFDLNMKKSEPLSSLSRFNPDKTVSGLETLRKIIGTLNRTSKNQKTQRSADNEFTRNVKYSKEYRNTVRNLTSIEKQIKT